MEKSVCTSCGGSREFPSGCLSCCRDCGFPCSIEKNAEAFHDDASEDAPGEIDEEYLEARRIEEEYGDREVLVVARAPHEKDEDCDVDPETDTCRACGVWHGDPCPACGGRGYHRPGCPDSDATAEEAADA